MNHKESRKVRTGQVVSDKMNKTVVVAVKRLRPHPRYKKFVRHTKKYKVHDENNICKVGDNVKIVETRPLSKEKRWRIMEVVSKTAGASQDDSVLQQT